MIKEESIRITSDGITVTARKYINGEIVYSAEATNEPGKKFDFDNLALDAYTQLMDKSIHNGRQTMKKSEQDNTVTKHYDDRVMALLHSACCAELKDMHKNKQDKTELINKSRCIYSTNGAFWEAFKRGEFTLEVKREDWTVFKVLAHFHGIEWSFAPKSLIATGFPGFEDIACLTFGCMTYASLCWGGSNAKFVGDSLLRWEELDIDD